MSSLSPVLEDPKVRKRATSDHLRSNQGRPFLGENWRRHVYQPLNYEAEQIRLLLLEPSSDFYSDPVGTLHTVNLGRTTFAALSYVWGDPSDQCRMDLNAYKIKIGRNAHTALRHLRRPNSPMAIWIDALCINQKDVQERSQQVTLMRAIFTVADPVILWVGVETKESGIALSIITDSIVHVNPHLDDRSHWREAPSNIVLEFVETVPDEYWQCLRSFLDQSFWHRVWIVQEIVLGDGGRCVYDERDLSGLDNPAKKCLLMNGLNVMHYYHFYKGLALLCNSVMNTLAQGRIHDYFAEDNLSSVVFAGHHIVQFPLLIEYNDEILRILANLRATDPKDYVYGFLGLMPDIYVSVDYTKSTEDIYKESTLAMLEKTKSLKFIVPSNPNRELPGTLPSWTVDWKQRSELPILWSQLSEYYDACGGKAAYVSRSDDRLRVSAHRLSHFQESSQLGPKTNFGDGEHADQLWDILLSLHDYAFEQLGPRPCESPTDIFERTLLLDLGHPERDSSSTCRLGPRRDGVSWDFIETALRLIQRQWNPATRLELTEDEAVAVGKLLNHLISYVAQLRIALEPYGCLCMVPASTQVGDCIYILAGGSMPFVLRPVPSGARTHYKIIGVAYVHGIMDGEAVSGFPQPSQYKTLNTAQPGACTKTGGILAYFEIIDILGGTDGSTETSASPKSKRVTIEPIHDEEGAVKYLNTTGTNGSLPR